MRFRIYDAFTRDGRGGKPAPVVLDAKGLTADERRSRARTLGGHVCAFVDGEDVSIEPRDLPYRPGHALLAASAARGKADERPALPPLVAQVANPAQPAFAARALNLAEGDVDVTRPVEAIVTDRTYLLVPLSNGAALARARLDTERLVRLLPRVAADAVVPFVLSEGVVRARTLVAGLGEIEDEASDGAAAALGAWGAAHAGIEAATIHMRQSELRVSREASGFAVAGALRLAAQGRFD